MSLKNYGFPSDEATDLSGIIESFEVKRAFEGPQVLISWDFYNDDDVDAVRILKKTGSYPLSINDGIEVFLATGSGYWADLDVIKGIVYYYTMFVKLAGEDNYVFDILGMCEVLVIETGYYQDSLWKSIPQLYRERDTEIQTKLILTKIL